MKNQNIPLITIAIPTHNRADSYLKTTIDSALSQTYQNYEVLISDNNSTDNTAELVNGYKDSRIRYYRHNENIGAWNNFNFCLEKARGDYFMILCDDDLIDADFLEVCMEHAQYRTDIGFISTGSRIIDENDIAMRQKENLANGLSNPEFILLWYKRGIHLFLCSSLFNSRFLKNEGGFKIEYDLFLDVATEFNIVTRYGRVDIPNVKASFRYHQESYGKKSKIVQWCDDSIKLLDLACSLVEMDHRNGYLRSFGMKTSAGRMYSEALHAGTFTGRVNSFYIVWKKFNRKYFPTRYNLAQLSPSFYFFLFPIKSVKRVANKLRQLLKIIFS